MDSAIVFLSIVEVCIDRLHDVSDISSSLLNVDNPRVFESGAFDEREEVVVERHQNPVVFECIREVLSVGIAQPLFVTSGVNCPATTAETVRDGNPDTLVTV
nr:hypothetical protein [Halegenticoccus soli]